MACPFWLRESTIHQSRCFSQPLTCPRMQGKTPRPYLIHSDVECASASYVCTPLPRVVSSKLYFIVFLFLYVLFQNHQPICHTTTEKPNRTLCCQLWTHNPQIAVNSLGVVWQITTRGFAPITLLPMVVPAALRTAERQGILHVKQNVIRSKELRTAL